MPTSHPPDHGRPPDHGSATHSPPSPHEELDHLGLVKPSASADASHHPDHDLGHDNEAKPTTAGAPTIRRPVA
jgi:hypothetical protein